ncbi:hypothetical protein [Sediminibacterium soli]|uniref:hypothetical protein n=1 Tax=Sediminibacterium soli TaxID=2698829 RepID=UPI00137B423F|nr:hypothetical protein [Sediminibacterium soli]NCI47338.1 hypothetical protein [Sediminibacterium soli]
MKHIRYPIQSLAVFVALIVLFAACQKETSLEKGGFNRPAEGELVDSLGICKRITVAGSYKVDTPLNSSNYIIVNVNFTAAGKYKIYSDTVNGMWFIDSGFVVSAGPNAIKLKGKGTPILNKQSDFSVFFKNTMCTFSINSNGTPNGGGSGSGGTGNTDYFPLTPGSSWVYDYIPDIGSVDTFTVIVSDQPIQLQNDPLVYYKFGTRLTDTFYFAKSSTGDYYALSSVDFDYTLLFESIPNTFISYPFLKPNAAVGETWETAEYGKVTVKNGSTTVSGMAKAVFKIFSKNTAAHTVGGKTYDNVIDVQRDILFKEDGGTTFTTLATGHSFYAKGFGLIDQVITIGGNTQNIPVYKTPVIK